MTPSNVVLCTPVRTRSGTFGGTLKASPAAELGAAVVKEALARGKLSGRDIGTVVMRQVVQAGSKMNPARQAMIGAAIPVEVWAMTVNRVCGSGAQAIVSADREVMLGHVSCAVAGGMENMDQAPYLPDAYDTGRIKDIYLKDDDSVIARRSSVR
jgi:acetyl-CoA C-acetyltransferase